MKCDCTPFTHWDSRCRPNTDVFLQCPVRYETALFLANIDRDAAKWMHIWQARPDGGEEMEFDSSFLSEMGFEGGDLERCSNYIQTAVNYNDGPGGYYKDERGVPTGIFIEAAPFPSNITRLQYGLGSVDYGNFYDGDRIHLFVSSLDGLDLVKTRLQYLVPVSAARIQLSFQGLVLAEDYSDWQAHSNPLRSLVLEILPDAAAPSTVVEEKVQALPTVVKLGQAWFSAVIMLQKLAQAAFLNGKFDLTKRQIKAAELTLGFAVDSLMAGDVYIGYPLASCSVCDIQLFTSKYSFVLFHVNRQ